MLVNLANLRGGSDNVTVVIARVSGSPGSAAEEENPTATPSLGLGWIITMWSVALLFVGRSDHAFCFDHFVEGVYLLFGGGAGRGGRVRLLARAAFQIPLNRGGGDRDHRLAALPHRIGPTRALPS